MEESVADFNSIPSQEWENADIRYKFTTTRAQLLFSLQSSSLFADFGVESASLILLYTTIDTALKVKMIQAANSHQRNP
jgi:hypothetical protein